MSFGSNKGFASSSTTTRPVNGTTVLDNGNTTISQNSTSVSMETFNSSSENDTYTHNSATETHDVGIKQCPQIGVKTGWHDDNLQASTSERNVGTTVHLTCKTGSTLRGSSTLRCLPTGTWNATHPHCEGAVMPASTLLLIGVVAGCCALVILVVVTILCKFLCCTKSKKDFDQSSVAGTVETSDRASTSPYYSVSILNGRPCLAPDAGSVHYAKPEIYSSFVNPSFYEDVYAKWRSREELTERLYESPYLINHRLAEQCQNPDVRWSTMSLNAHEKYDYGRFGKIPRSQVTENEIEHEEELTSL